MNDDEWISSHSTYRISQEIFEILITGFKVSSLSVTDFDLRTGAEHAREWFEEAFFVPLLFFFSSAMIFFEFNVLRFLFIETNSVSEESSDAEVLKRGLMMIVFRRGVVDWDFVDENVGFESTDKRFRT